MVHLGVPRIKSAVAIYLQDWWYCSLSSFTAVGFCWQHKFASDFQHEEGPPAKFESPSPPNSDVTWDEFSAFLLLSQEAGTNPFCRCCGFSHCSTFTATGMAEWLFLITASYQGDYHNPAFPRTHQLSLASKLVCQLPIALVYPNGLSQNIFVSLHCLPCFLRIITELIW